MILLIDNYDSFSYNLYQLIGSITKDEIKVIRNDEMTIEEIRDLNPDQIVLSPGPGKPSDAGICESVVTELGSEFPILGICLGHQSICESLGGVVSYAKKLMHGKQSVVSVNNEAAIFKGLESNVKVARYHSLAAVADKLPECLEVIATSDDGEVMAVKHKEYNIFGLQFHPESVLTENGDIMMKNFLSI